VSLLAVSCTAMQTEWSCLDPEAGGTPGALRRLAAARMMRTCLLNRSLDSDCVVYTHDPVYYSPLGPALCHQLSATNNIMPRTVCHELVSKLQLDAAESKS
jgi:hypothetical protein